jgi:hypothetical protein
MRSSDSGSSGLEMVVVKPQVVGSVRTHIMLVAIQITIPHILLIIYYIIMSLQALSTLPDESLIAFLDDTIEYLKGVRVPFMSKYAE